MAKGGCWIAFLCCSATLVAVSLSKKGSNKVSASKSIVYGPALNNRIVTPARYLYVQAVDGQGKNFTSSPGQHTFRADVIAVSSGQRSPLKVKGEDRGDGTYQFMFFFNFDVEKLLITVFTKNGERVGKGEYVVKGVEIEGCYCPADDPDDFAHHYQCRSTETQIDLDFAKFPKITQKMVDEAITKLNENTACFIHVVIKNNKVYGKAHGPYQGFKEYLDEMILSLARRVRLPDVEFVFNMGDWPQANLSAAGLPVISWCGSNDTDDIVVPTYKTTLATLFGKDLESMREVDGSAYEVGGGWKKKKNKMIWRGRDCTAARVRFVDEIAAPHKKYIDAEISKNHFNYYPTPEARRNDKRLHAGKKVNRMPFLDFWKYKYLLNLDGTVAAYRLGALLAGDSVVLRHESKWYEHFYADLVPWEHYIPIKEDLSDAVEQLHWARNHDRRAQAIARQGRQFVRERLRNEDIYCYYFRVLQRYHNAMDYKPQVRKGKGLKETKQEDKDCRCSKKKKLKKTKTNKKPKDEL